jgi:transposase
MLPVVEREFTLDEADRICPSCGGGLRPMTGQDRFEESELIDVIEARYELVKVKQQKYVCRCGGCVETAIGPERAIPGSRYSLALAIKVVLDKWLDHIPLERQCRILERHGLVVTSQTLWDLANALARRLTCLDAALQAHVLERPVIGLDQTSWPRLEGADSKPWQMWCLTAPGVVVHRIRDDKSAATFIDLVGKYTGTIVCDALSTHGAGARAGPGIVLAGCWAHYPEFVVIWCRSRRTTIMGRTVHGSQRRLQIMWAVTATRGTRSASAMRASDPTCDRCRRVSRMQRGRRASSEGSSPGIDSWSRYSRVPGSLG